MFIEPISPEAADGLLADIYESERAKWGFLPTFVMAFSHHPEAYQAWLTLVGIVYAGMDRRRLELATLAATRVLESTCCAVAHGKTLRDLFYKSDEVAQIALDHHRAGLDEVDVAIMDFAEKAAGDPAGMTQSDVDKLRSYGLTDRDVFDIALAVAARAFLATLIETLGTRAERPLVEDLESVLLDALSFGRSAT